MSGPRPAGRASPTVAELEDCLSEPTPELAADLAAIPGDILVLGVAGKMGPTLARMAKRAAPERRVVGVARFSDHGRARGLGGSGRRDDRLRPAASPRRRGAAEAAQRRLHGGHEVRRLRQSGADLGHERARPRHRRRGLRRPRASSPSRPAASTRSCPSMAAAPPRTRRPCRRPATTPGRASGASACSSISRSGWARPAASCGSTTPSTCATACCTTSAPRCWPASRST